MPWTGIGSALGGIAGAGATIAAAKYNLQAQRESNQTNLQLAREQNQWNLDQWNRENEYNTPAAQRQRMLDAGINPLGQSFDSGNASQLTSTNLANQQPETVDAAGIGNSIHTAAANINNVVAQYFQIKKLNAETENIGKDTAYKDLINRNFAEEFTNRMNLMKAQTGWTNEQTWESRYTRPLRMSAIRADIHVKDSQRGLNLLEQGLYTYKYHNQYLLNQFQEIVNKWQDTLSADQHKQLMAGTAWTYTQIRQAMELLAPNKAVLEAQARDFNASAEGKEYANKAFSQLNGLQMMKLQAEIYSIMSSGRLNDIKYIRERWKNYLEQSGLDRVINGSFSNPLDSFSALVSLMLGGTNVVQNYGKNGFNWQIQDDVKDFSSVSNPLERLPQPSAYFAPWNPN